MTTLDLSPHLPVLRAYAHTLTRDRDRAADLVQDTCLRALENTHKFTPDPVHPFKSLRSWLCTVMRRLHISQQRKQIYRTRQMTYYKPLEYFSTIPASQEDRIQLREIFERINSGVFDTLSMRIIHLLIFQEYAPHEIADELSIPPGTVGSRLWRIRSVLRSLAQIDSTYTTDTVRLRTLRYIERHTQFTRRDLVRTTRSGTSTSNIDGILRELVKQGKLLRTSHGAYTHAAT